MGEAGASRNRRSQTAVLRHIGNIFRFSSSDFAQSLLSLFGLIIGRRGDD
jgi:hypothetical protein